MAVVCGASQQQDPPRSARELLNDFIAFRVAASDMRLVYDNQIPWRSRNCVRDVPLLQEVCRRDPDAGLLPRTVPERTGAGDGVEPGAIGDAAGNPEPLLASVSPTLPQP